VSLIKPESVEAVKAAVDMVDLVSGRTQLRKAGTEWSGRCPFHSERTASFWVNPLEKVYYCFGCQAKGDAISFVRETRPSTIRGPWSGWPIATACGWSTRSRRPTPTVAAGSVTGS